jgi:serine protein kinase
VAPHVSWAIAMWTVLTRLKKPNSINYPPNISTLISNLTPLEKSRLYDNGDLPISLTPDERKLLRSSLRKLKDEYTNIPYYEGRMGASAREMKTVLSDAAQNPEFSCLSPLAVLRELEEFVKKVSEYEFLKQDVKDGFHDGTEFIHTVRNEYLNKIDREVRDSIGLYDSAQWEEFLKKYVQQTSLVLKKEKVKNPITGKMEDPDFALISEFEKIVDAPSEQVEKDAFRQNIISQIGVWSLDHPKENVIYAKVFPEFWRKLEKHYYESQKALLTKMSDALLVYDKKEQDLNTEGSSLARQTVNNMKAKSGYCQHCASEVITFLMRQRY